MITIYDYRSFDEEGVSFKTDKQINVFIGKNNSGKSNILRFIKRLEEIRPNTKDKIFGIEDQHKRNGRNPSISFRINARDFVHEFVKDALVDMKINLFTFHEEIDMSFLDEFEDYQLVNFQIQYPRASRDHLISAIKSQIERKKFSLFDEFDKVLYIPSIRAIGLEDDHKTDNDRLEDFDGAVIVNALFKMQNPDIGYEEERDKFLRIQEFVREVLENENIIIEIPNTKDKIIVETDQVRLPIEQFGTGIHQLVILASALIIYNDAVFCIEEPEVHLHPELQRKLINFLKSTDNKYFITTHSSVFIDFDESINIHHIVYKNGVSKIDYCVSANSIYSILNDLGYKNSDLLQSNGIIWVEGPSDRHYIKKWISLVNDDLIEGIDYSIMFYGGKNLANLSFSVDLIDENFIELLKINRNALVVIDKDAKKITSKLNQTKVRIQNEIGEGRCWITNGREIENYLPEELINEWIGQNRIESKKTNTSFDKYSKLEDYILDQITPGTKTIDYSKQKNRYSREIAALLTIEHLDRYDLRSKVSDVIDYILMWNK